MLHTNVKHEPSTYTEAITERGAQCTRYGFAQKKRNLLQETAVGIIFTMGPKNLFWSSIFYKVNSVQEACAKCSSVHILQFEILQTTWENEQKASKC